MTTTYFGIDSIYVGERHDGLPHGVGTLTQLSSHFPEQLYCYNGAFQHGQFHGQGSLSILRIHTAQIPYTPGDISQFSEGTWEKDMMTGPGCSIFPDGDTAFYATYGVYAVHKLPTDEGSLYNFFGLTLTLRPRYHNLALRSYNDRGHIYGLELILPFSLLNATFPELSTLTHPADFNVFRSFNPKPILDFFSNPETKHRFLHEFFFDSNTCSTRLVKGDTEFSIALITQLAEMLDILRAPETSKELSSEDRHSLFKEFSETLGLPIPDPLSLTISSLISFLDAFLDSFASGDLYYLGLYCKNEPVKNLRPLVGVSMERD